MKEIDKEEMTKIDGGLSVWGGIGIGAAVVFLIGVIDGIVRPLRCN